MNGRQYMGLVAQVPCVLCSRNGTPQNGRTFVHHIRDGQGMQQRAADWLTVALCESCHVGRGGVHGDKTLLRIAKVSEIDLLADTIKAVMQV